MKGNFEHLSRMKAVINFGFYRKTGKVGEQIYGKEFICTPLVLVLVLLLFAAIGCDRGKTDKASEQKISQLQSFALPQETNDLDLSLEGVEDRGGNIAIAGWAAIKSQDSTNALKYFVLQSKSKTYIFDTFSLWKRPDVTKVYKLDRDNSGFNVFIPKDKIERGEYRAGIIIKKDKMTSFQYYPGKTLKL